MHLLNLLCIPAIVLVYCYRRYPNIETKGSLLALLVSFVIVAAVLYGVVPGIITVGGWFELLFVNVLGMPFNTGEIIYIVLLVAAVCWAIWETYQEGHDRRQNIAFVVAVALLGIPFYGYGWSAVVIGVVVLALLWWVLNYKKTIDKKAVPVVGARLKNTVLCCLLMLMIGYSSYALIVIRSSANPPMDQNSPEDIFTLGSYLSRDQYGDRPLLYGRSYTSQVALETDGNMCKPVMNEGAPIYSRREKASQDEKDSYFVVSHKNTYKYAQNMLFPRMHSASHAQAYEQWMGGIDGTIIPFDRCGEMVNVKMPTMFENLKFFLSYQCNFMYWRYFMWNFAGRQNDMAIVVYLNQTPLQPRERDYAYAGSFYAFAIWCGIGVAALIDIVKRYLKLNNAIVAAVVSAVCLLVPVQMASQTWDDHDRSGRYTCRDFGQNYLMTLQDEGNPIIFTNGDNDTFPLWYNMDVEGVRPDARVCNLSYLQTDWYIDQMVRPAYESPSLPITWSRLEYCSGTNEYVEVVPSAEDQVKQFYAQDPDAAREQFGDEPFELKNILKYWVRSKDQNMHFIPTDTVFVTIDKDAVRKSGMLMASDTIPDKMVISLAGKRALYKGDLMMLEMISQANWVRPIYVAMTVGQDNYMNLGENFVQEGLANRITPFSTYRTDDRGNLQPIKDVKNFDTEKTYRNVMERYKYGGLQKPGLYLDETVMRMCYTHRNLMGSLAKNLLQEGKDDKALAVLQKCEKEIPYYNVPVNFRSGSFDMAETYAHLGKKEQALNILGQLWKNADQYMTYYLSLSSYVMQRIIQLTKLVDEDLASKMENKLNTYYNAYAGRGGQVM